MLLKRTLMLIFIISSAVFFTSCCSCGKSTTQENTIKGYIVVIGNEPFTKLALKSENGMVYVLECSDKIEKELWSNQGNYYSIMYKESRVEEMYPILEVETATQLKTDSK